jgi:hypothetical protein
MGGISPNKFIALAIVLFLVTAGLYCRIPQVAVFVLAATLQAPQTNPFIPREAMNEWGSIAPQKTLCTPRFSGTAVTYHPEYHSFQAGTAIRCIEAAAALNVEYLRSDVRWSAVLPDGETPNQDAFGWYRSFFGTARTYGLQPIIVLSSPPRGVRHLPNTELLQRWQIYVEQVVLNLGDLCNIYQVLNEPNNPIYAIFDKETLPKAIIVASQSIKANVTDAKIVVNFLVDIPRWRQEAERLLFKTGTSIDVVGIDHYPGTWTIGPTRGWGCGIKMLSKIDPTKPETPWYGRKLAIAETGYSTNVPILRGPREQEHFFRDLDQNLQHLGTLREALLFVGFYELCDSDSRAFLNPEAHFGLLKGDCITRKPAFTIAQRISLERIP